MKKCQICGQKAAYNHNGLPELWKCDVCGCFVMSVGQIAADNAYKVSAAIRKRMLSEQVVNVTQAFVDEALSIPDKSVHEKLRLVLEYVEARTKYFGQAVAFRDSDYPLIEAKNSSELRAIVGVQAEQRNLDSGDREIDERGDIVYEEFVLTVKGIETLDQMRQMRPDAHRVFVAMWFEEQMDRIYREQIAPAITRTGYDPVRIDLVPHNDDIIARVLTEIRLAKFIIADFTGHRNGVYFEAGFAKALGLEVVWMCREDDIKNAHFDTNHFNHLTWKDDGRLQASLKARILATIGPGPKYRPED